MPPSNRANRTTELRACARWACGRIGEDVRVFDVSSVVATVRLALCPSCVSRERADALTIVEAVDPSELAA